jgi:hypothetical protein
MAGLAAADDERARLADAADEMRPAAILPVVDQDAHRRALARAIVAEARARRS